MAGVVFKRLVEDKLIYADRIDAWGDLGTREYFLDTVMDVLEGKFRYIHEILSSRRYDGNPEYWHDATNNLWIHRDALERPHNGKTLLERMEAGVVEIGPNVFIGRRGEIEAGARLRYTDLEKYGFVGANAELDHFYGAPGCQIGPHAQVIYSALGVQVLIESSEKNPTKIAGRSIIGGELVIPQGTSLSNGTIVLPGYEFNKPGQSFSGDILKPTDEQSLAIIKAHQELE